VICKFKDYLSQKETLTTMELKLLKECSAHWRPVIHPLEKPDYFIDISIKSLTDEQAKILSGVSSLEANNIENITDKQAEYLSHIDRLYLD
jgi:hypothetical protein